MNNEIVEIEQSLQSINPKVLGSYEQDSKFDSEIEKLLPEAELYPLTNISDRFFLGNIHAVNEDLLKQNNIQYVINMAEELNDVLPRGFFCYKISHFKKYSTPEVYDEIFEEFYNTILSIPSSGRIVIHCKHGKSRSAMMLIALIMRQFRVDYKRALHWVKSKRPSVEPNIKFSRWLKKLNLQEFQAKARQLPFTVEKASVKHLRIPVNGYYSHFGQNNNLGINNVMVDLDGHLKANGVDSIGSFFIVGNIDRSGYTSFIKQYLGKHCVTYQGKLAGLEITGKWDILGTGDEFIIELKMDKWLGNGFNERTNEEISIEMNMQIDEYSGEIIGLTNSESGTNQIYGKSDGEKLYFIQQYLGSGDMYIFEVICTGKTIKGKWKDASGSAHGNCELSRV